VGPSYSDPPGVLPPPTSAYAATGRTGPGAAAGPAGSGVVGWTCVEYGRADFDVLGAWQSAWRQGRGRPVLRETLEKCPAISGVFIDRVADYAVRLDGDGRALVLALRDGELKGFRTGRADDLEAYLLEEGCIDDAPRLSEEEMWARVVERVGASCTGDTPSLAEVRAFLGRVASPPSSLIASAQAG
jgi:hypothetical protein